MTKAVNASRWAVHGFCRIPVAKKVSGDRQWTDAGVEGRPPPVPVITPRLQRHLLSLRQTSRRPCSTVAPGDATGILRGTFGAGRTPEGVSFRHTPGRPYSAQAR